jgi:membrane protease YdiL (CAAX protease family)
MGSFQSHLGLRHAFHDRMLYLAIGCSLVLGSAFWLLLPCSLITMYQITPTFLLLVLFVYPVVEEIIFRGTVQELLLQRKPMKVTYYGISRANMMTSCLFGGFHLMHQPFLFAILIIMPSILLGYFKERYSTLAVPIGLHILFNGIFIVSTLQRSC